MQRRTKGYLLGIISAATYGTNPVFAVPLYREGFNVDSVLFFRYLMALPILYIMMRWRNQSLRIPRRSLSSLAILGFLMAASSLALFMSYQYMDVGIASTILFVYPVIVALIMALGFGERLRPLTICCIFLSLIGILLLYGGGEGGTALSILGISLVLASALSYAIYMVYIHQAGLGAIPTVKVTFYVLFFGLFLFIGKLSLGAPLVVPHTWHHWLYLFALAFLPTVVSLICTTIAIHCIGATPTAILGALEPVTALCFGVLVFHEILTFRAVGGILLILVSVTTIVAGGSIVPQLLRIRRLFPRRWSIRH